MCDPRNYTNFHERKLTIWLIEMAKHIKFALVLLLMLFMAVTHAQQVWDIEKQRTLAEMTKLRREIVNRRHPIFTSADAGDFALNNSAVTSRVKLKYMGERRAIPVSKRRLLEGMAGAYALDPPGIRSLAEEVLFKEGDQEYWIPAQKRTLSVIEDVLKIGAEEMFYIDLVGAYRTEGKWEWVFTVNEIASKTHLGRNYQ